MSDPTRGITCPDMKRVIREALAGGWEFAGMTGTTHGRIVWPATGDTVTFGTTPGLASWKSTATQIMQTSAVEVWRKGNRKRSRKADDVSGFSIDRARRDQDAFHNTVDLHPDDALKRRDDLVDECQRIAADPHRTDVSRLPQLWQQISALEDKLKTFGRDVDRFNPETLIDLVPVVDLVEAIAEPVKTKPVRHRSSPVRTIRPARPKKPAKAPRFRRVELWRAPDHADA